MTDVPEHEGATAAAPQQEPVGSVSPGEDDVLTQLRAQLDEIDELDTDARIATFEAINETIVAELARLDEF